MEPPRQLVRVRYGYKPTVSGFNSLTVTKTRRTPTAIVAYAMIVFFKCCVSPSPSRREADLMRRMQAAPGFASCVQRTLQIHTSLPTYRKPIRPTIKLYLFLLLK